MDARANALLAPFAFALRVLRGFRANHGFLLASAVAYNTLLSIVPLFVVLLVALSHLVDQRRLLHLIGTSLEEVLPGRSAAITDQVAGFLANGKVVGLTGAVSLLFFSSVAFTVLESALALIFHHRAENRRSSLFSAALPYLFIMAFGLALLAGTLVSGLLAFLRRASLVANGPPAASTGALLWLGGALGLVALLTSLYKVLPKGRVSLRHALAGALTATVLWELLRSVVAWYFTTLSMVGVVYGSLATTVVVLLTLEIAALILLLGAQVVAELERSPAS